MRTLIGFMLPLPLGSTALTLLLTASGSLTAAQIEAADHHPLFDRIDTNHDSQISLAEWQAWRERRRDHQEDHASGPAPTMASLNHAAGVTVLPHSDTVPSTAPPAVGEPHRGGAGGERLFTRIDANHDGVISLEEWVAFRAERRHHHEHAAPGTPGTTPPAGAATPTSTPQPVP